MAPSKQRSTPARLLTLFPADKKHKIFLQVQKHIVVDFLAQILEKLKKAKRNYVHPNPEKKQMVGKYIDAESPKAIEISSDTPEDQSMQY
jgi:hypothetical protein